MKKILATLLVATMLFSCLTFIGFAAGQSAYTDANFPNDSMKAIYDSSSDEYSFSTLGDKYYNYVLGAEGKTQRKGADLKDSHPLFFAMWNQFYDYEENYGAVSYPTSVIPGEYVILPLYLSGCLTWDIDVEYDPTLFEYLEHEAIISGTVTDGLLSTNSTGLNVKNMSCFYSAEQSGLASIFYFKVLNGTGDSEGKANASINIVAKELGALDGSKTTTMTVPTMSVSLTGLEKGEEEEKDPVDITGDDFATSAGVVSSVVPTGASCVAASGLSAADKAMFVAGNADSDIANAADDAVYSAVFATVDLTGKNAPEAYGFVIIPEDGTGARFYEAKAETVVGGKFGMVFFGDAATLGLYKAAPAVKVDGEWLYNAENASAL